MEDSAEVVMAVEAKVEDWAEDWVEEVMVAEESVEGKEVG